MLTQSMVRDDRVRQNFRDFLSGRGPVIFNAVTAFDPVLEFAKATADGLARSPRRLESRFLYDSRGSALFDLITLQPEYYLTATETAILARHAGRIREITGPITLVEFGSGSSVKTDHLLRAWKRSERRVRYVPVDVSVSALKDACSLISVRHPEVELFCLHCDYSGAFPLVKEVGRCLLIFLGSSIGNFSGSEIEAFLLQAARSLCAGDFFLVGIDLVKESAVIEAAYNDAAGITAKFTKNLFCRMNRELSSRIDADAVEHLAVYNEATERVDIHARFVKQQDIFIAPLGLTHTVRNGELIRTEVCTKFRLKDFLPLLDRNGFQPVEVFTDPREWFALVLARRTSVTPRCFREDDAVGAC